MAELPNRDLLESEFARRFGRVARRHSREFRRLLGDPPSLDNVPQEFFDKMQRETDAELYAILLLIFDESAIYHGWDTPESGLAAYGWAKQRAEDFSKYWVESTQTRLEKGFDKLTAPEPVRETTVDEAREANRTITGPFRRLYPPKRIIDGEPIEDDIGPMNRILPGQEPVKIPTKEEIDELLSDTFGENRIEQNAVDETTRARFAGGEAAIEETVGISQEDRWRNNPRNSKAGPCKICISLNGLRRADWPWRYREGPPSPHKFCVCDVDYQNVPLSDAIGRMQDDPDYKSMSAQPRFNLKSWYRVIPNAAEWRAHCRENELDVNDRSAFKAFNASESRDDHGRWTVSGSHVITPKGEKHSFHNSPEDAQMVADYENNRIESKPIIAESNRLLKENGHPPVASFDNQGHPTIHPDEIRDAIQQVHEANELLKDHPNVPKAKVSVMDDTASSTHDPEQIKDSIQELKKINDILEKHGQPQIGLSHDADFGGVFPDVSDGTTADDAAELDRESAKLNKRLESYGLNPKVHIKLTKADGSHEIGLSHDPDELSEALDMLRDFKNKKSLLPEWIVKELEPLGFRSHAIH